MQGVAIVLGRCNQGRRLFGIRFVSETDSVWVGVWAFDVLEQEAKREQWDDNRIDGTFSFGPEYPGCPYCGAHSVAKCGCGRITCWNGTQNSLTCAWCGSTGRLGGVVKSLSGGEDA
jgi:TerY-C metal binding domain